MKISLDQPNGIRTHFASQPHKYIEHTQPVKEHARRQFNPYVNNEGTVVAVAGEDFVVVAGDSRLSEGYSIVTRNESKLVQLTDKTIMATSGMYADFCELTRVLKAKLEIYDFKIERQPGTESVAHLVSKTLYGRRFFPYYTFNLIAGIDKNGKGVVYGYDAIGSYGSDKALAQGSGAHMILPFLDAEVTGYNNPKHSEKPPLSIHSAVELVYTAFRSAAERDIYTGDKLQILVVTKDGVQREWRQLRRD